MKGCVVKEKCIFVHKYILKKRNIMSREETNKLKYTIALIAVFTNKTDILKLLIHLIMARKFPVNGKMLIPTSIVLF